MDENNKKEDKEESKVVSGSSRESLAFLSIIAKNTFYIPKLAEDLNIARQNIVKLVKIKGGLSTNKADGSFLSSSSAEEELARDKEKYAPTPAKPKEENKKEKGGILSKIGKSKVGKKIGGIFGSLKSMFMKGNILKIVLGLGIVAGIVTYFWDSITQAWEEWKESSGIWDAITSGLDGVVDFFKGIIDSDMIASLTSSVSDFLAPVTDAIGNFFSGFADWFSQKFDVVKEFFGVPLVAKKQPEQKLEAGNKTKEKLPEAPTQKEQAKPQAPAPQKDTEKADRKAKEEEVRKLYEQEKAVQYHGRDEIVRERMGLQKKSAEDLAKEYKVELPSEAPTPATKEAPTPTKPTPTTVTPPSTAPTKETKGTPISVGSDDKWIMDMIKKHEGVRTRPYKDSLGLWTVGVGHLIGDGKSLPPEWDREFSMQEVDELFAKDYEHHKKMAMKMPGFDKANKATQGAMIDLAFNMGGAWYKKWPKFMEAFVAGNMQQAAEQLESSKWYKQVKGRAATIVNLIKSGGASTAPTPTNDTPKPMSSPAAAESAPTGTVSASTGSGNVQLNSVVKTQSGVDLNVNSEFSKRVAAMAADFKEKTGKTLLITSGYRSNEKQKELWDAKLKETGGDEAAARKWVAQPAPPLGKGRGSPHLKGMALDINSKGPNGINVLAGTATSSTGWLEKFGLVRPIKHEDWHVQPTGVTPVADNPDNPGKPIQVADKSGKPTDVATGKQQSTSTAVAPTTPSSGATISSTSTEVASGQRQQQKPQTPVIVNAPTTNNTTIAANKPAGKGESSGATNTPNKLATRLA